MATISIHGPRVGADAQLFIDVHRFLEISIHGPRVGADYMNLWLICLKRKFQSTAPVWGPTRPF